MNARSHFAFRLLTSFFALLLGIQSVWLLLAELSRPGIRRLPTDAASRSSLEHALTDAPDQSSAWLLLAGLASRDQLRSIDAKEAHNDVLLQMSYYTGPSELELMPLRLRVAIHSDAFSDIELRDSLSRGVRLLFAHQQKFAIVAAYNASPSAERQFIEQAIREIDPSVAESLRASAGGFAFARLAFSTSTDI
jgi:hypothetical protein